jgi:hypothetical protein
MFLRVEDEDEFVEFGVSSMLAPKKINRAKTRGTRVSHQGKRQ